MSARTAKQALAKQARVAEANKLLQIIGSHGRRFFYSEKHDRFAHIEVDSRGRVWFHDDHTGARVYTHDSSFGNKWYGFSHGGTMRELICALRDYIGSGRAPSRDIIAPQRYDFSDIWGYGDEAAQAVRAQAWALPMFFIPPPTARKPDDTEERVRALHGRGISLTRAADLLGISPNRLRNIADVLGLDWPKFKGRQVVIDGIKDTISAHARRLGMSSGGLNWRLNKHGTHEPQNQRFKRPAGVEKFVEYRRQGIPAWRAAVLAGDSFSRLDKWARRDFPDYQVVIRSAKRVRRTKAQLQQERRA